ncbi:hypothetical protein [Halorubellus salinus]|uniref:hypothetical protein n=1 Tax=Halorubellus salinus TaxID=755309 RepID=UPI001D07AAE9|nr:hypothetical protein [Halorubellus salinus]
MLPRHERAPDAVAASAAEGIEGVTAPPKDALVVLESVTESAPHALAPVQETLWAWADAIRPGDDRWSDLVTVRGRVAIATDDTDRLSRLLHLEDVDYCKRLLDTAVATELVEAAPNKAVPALLDHLEGRDTVLRKRVLSLFATPPHRFGGWAPTIRDAVLERTTDHEQEVRAAAVETLTAWVEALNAGTNTDGGTTRDDGFAADDRADRLSAVRSAVVEQLHDEHWRVRARAARGLGAAVDAETRTTLASRLSCEDNQTVRFEIQRILSRER